MSTDDVDKVFGYLDKKRQGFITYNEFCLLNQDKKRRRQQTNPPSSLTKELIDENM